MLMGAAAQSGAATGEFDLGAMLEEHKYAAQLPGDRRTLARGARSPANRCFALWDRLLQEENEQLQGMVDQTLADLDAALGKAARTTESLHFVEESLAQYEEENKGLLEELQTLKLGYKKSSGNLDSEVKELRSRTADLELRLEEASKAKAAAEAEASLWRVLPGARLTHEDQQKKGDDLEEEE
jgi:outer membrane murein-binding lipoprotein Lpp